MSIDVRIKGNNGTRVEVTRSGELVVAPLAYSETHFDVLDTPNTAYSFFPPEKDKQFVITGFNMKADRDVSSTVDASVIIYEASSVDTTTEDKILFQEAMVKGERTGYTNTNLLVNAGKWVNAKTTDDDIHMTIMGYYIDKLKK